MLFGLILGMLTTMIVYAAYILVISFTLWMAVDAAKQDRYWWVVLVIGVPIIGSAVYFFTEKKHVYATALSHHIHLSETEKQHERSHPKKHSHKKHESVSVEQEKVPENETKTEVPPLVIPTETAPPEEEKKEPEA